MADVYVCVWMYVCLHCHVAGIRWLEKQQHSEKTTVVMTTLKVITTVNIILYLNVACIVFVFVFYFYSIFWQQDRFEIISL